MEEETLSEMDILSEADFTSIKNGRTRNAFIAQEAEKTILESKIAELEYKNIVLNMYIKYGLKISDSIDETTGKIIRKEEEKAK